MFVGSVFNVLNGFNILVTAISFIMNNEQVLGFHL